MTKIILYINALSRNGYKYLLLDFVDDFVEPTAKIISYVIASIIGISLFLLFLPISLLLVALYRITNCFKVVKNIDENFAEFVKWKRGNQ